MSEVAELYGKLDTRQKRLVMRFLRALSENFDGKEMTKICRIVNRQKPNKIRKKSGYILFYTEQYQKIKNSNPDLTLGQIAKQVGFNWGKLPTELKEKYNKQAADGLSL